MALSRIGAGKIQDVPGASCSTRKDKYSKKKKKKMGACQRDTRTNLKDLPMTEAGTI